MGLDAMTPEFAAAFVAALAELNDPGKSRTADAGGYTYKYVGLSDVLSDVRPVLARHGLVVVQEVATEGLDDRHVAVAVTTLLIHTSGAVYRSPQLTLVAPPDPQRIGSAVSYARRYAVMGVLGIAASDEDDDGASARPAPATPDRGKSKRPPAPEPPPATSAKVRSVAEQRIRQMLEVAPEELRSRAQRDFKAEFGVTLTRLETDRHDEALNWMLNRLDPEHPNNLDAADRAAADEAHADAEASQASRDA